MKTRYLLLTVLSLIIVSCNKQDDLTPESTEAFIDGEYFSPYSSSAMNTGSGYVLIFQRGIKKITIRTNDTITGTYNIVSQLLKSAPTLQANILYYNGETEYKGNEGTLKITKKEGHMMAGIYNSNLIANNGSSINLESGSFIDLPSVSLLPTVSGIITMLETCYTKLFDYIEFLYLFDAVYSDEVSAPNGSWTEIYNHALTSSTQNEKVLNLWTNGFELIYKINLILESTKYSTIDEADRTTINAQAKAIRSYLFYNLMIWFGEIPLETGIDESTNPRNKIAEVIVQIKEDASSAALALPLQWPKPDSFRIPKNFAIGLLARVNLTNYQVPTSFQINPTHPMYLYNNCNESVLNAQQIINCDIYSLDNKKTNFSASDREIIWGFEKRANAEFNNFFNKGSFVPVLRLTEVYLILAEALIQIGNPQEAVPFINLLNNRLSITPATAVTPNEIFQQWRTELTPEGSLWITKRRFFDKAINAVQNDPKKILLPIPQSVLIKNPNLTQNVGY